MMLDVPHDVTPGSRGPASMAFTAPDMLPVSAGPASSGAARVQTPRREAITMLKSIVTF